MLVRSDFTSPLFLLNFDTFILMCENLDPWSLYYLSLTHPLIQKLVYSNIIWERILSSQFPEVNIEAKYRDKPNYFFAFFSKISNERYRGFSNKKKECFTLVRAKDVFALEKRQIHFTITSLSEHDNDNQSLFSLVKKTNYSQLNNYIFNNLCNKNLAYTKKMLIAWGIKLNQSTGEFENLLKSKKNINNIYIDNYPIVYYAAAENSMDSIKKIIEMNASIHPLPNSNILPLYVAASKGHLNMVKYLTQLNANVNALAQDGSSSLYIAMQEGQAEIVKFLLENAADIHLKYRNAYAPLYIGARNGRINCLKILLPYCTKKDIDEESGEGATPLYTAAQNGYTETCELLLKNNANPESSFAGGYTPLYIAAQNGHQLIVETLIQFNANPCYVMPNGAVPLYVTCQNGFTEIARLLCNLDNKNNFIDHPYAGSYTPLYVASQKGHLNIVKILIAAGANINHLTQRNASPLYVAAQKGRKKIVNLLIANHANVNLAFENGFTPLHIVCVEHDENIGLPIIKALIKAGVDLFKLDKNAKTAAMLANNDKIKDILILSEQIIKHCEEKKLHRFPILLISEDIINKIENYIEILKNKISFTVTSIESQKKLQSSELALSLLKHSHYSFIHAVILYALLLIKNNKGLTKLIAHSLAFDCIPTAKNWLYQMLTDYLGENANLLNQLSQLIIAGIEENQTFLADADDTLLFCFNLYAMKMRSFQMDNPREIIIPNQKGKNKCQKKI